MNPEDTLAALFFEHLPVLSGAPGNVTESCLESLRTTYPMMDGSVYVVDLYERCFRFVSPGHLFLRGHLPGEAQSMGYMFYSRIVHPDDLQLLIDINHIVFDYFHNPQADLHKLAYITYNFRIGHNGEEQMVCHKMCPLMANNRPQMAVCVVTESVRGTTGNLAAYYKGSPSYMQYSPGKRKWEQQTAIELTPQEKKMLKLARQGKSKEAAEIMCLTVQSVQNLKQRIYRKFDVNSLEQAVIFARNQYLDLS